MQLHYIAKQGYYIFSRATGHNVIPKVTLKVKNQDRMFLADFSVNCQPIFKKFCNNHISTESLYPWKFRKIIDLYRILKVRPFDM